MNYESILRVLSSSAKILAKFLSNTSHTQGGGGGGGRESSQSLL